MGASLATLFSPSEATFVRADTMPAIVMVLASTTAAADSAASSSAPFADPEPVKKKPLDAAQDQSLGLACNCYAYLAALIGELPHMADIVPTGGAKIGAVAIFYYHDKHTGLLVKHVALVEKISDSGFTVAESNFTHCLFDQRVILWGDSHLVGFWSS